MIDPHAKVVAAINALVDACDKYGCACAASVVAYDRLQNDAPPGARVIHAKHGPARVLANMLCGAAQSLVNSGDGECSGRIERREPQIPNGGDE